MRNICCHYILQCLYDRYRITSEKVLKFRQQLTRWTFKRTTIQKTFENSNDSRLNAVRKNSFVLNVTVQGGYGDFKKFHRIHYECKTLLVTIVWRCKICAYENVQKIEKKQHKRYCCHFSIQKLMCIRRHMRQNILMVMRR